MNSDFFHPKKRKSLKTSGHCVPQNLLKADELMTSAQEITGAWFPY